ncbi:MAG: carboxypeptidase-like regulatory domain-containing protein [Lewinella sp.]
MKRPLLLVFFSFQLAICVAQISSSSILLSATVLAAEEGQPLPYANIYNKRLQTGTATNLNGYFELPNNRIGDTVEVSYLGYISRQIVIAPQMPETIGLNRSNDLLGEVVVTAQDDYLYDLVGEARKNNKTIPKTSKTYFYLETFLLEEPVEIIEAYYNGTYLDYGIEDLKYKKGRIGLRPVNRRYFSSTESSLLFSKHDVFSKSYLFPDNPLCLRKGALKRRYDLQLRNRFNDSGSKIYVVDFQPRRVEDLFSGTLWIDQSEKRIIKISLKISDSKKHPFTPIGYNTIQDVDMEITRSYTEIDQQLYLSTIDFNYSVAYVDTLGTKQEAKTSAYSKAYDYNQTFNLPYFKFTKAFHKDYRNITVSDYDALFWNKTTEFRFYDRLEETEQFIQENRLENNVIYSGRDTKQQQLQWPYIRWTEERFKMSEAPVSKIEPPLYISRYRTNWYNLDVKLFLDVNFLGDSMTFQLMAILDPIDTYYYFYLKNNDHAFMNMYFDLMEIQQRQLRAELLLLSHPTKEELDQLYEKHVAEYDKKARTFVSETKRGANLNNMEKWNDYIYNHLQVDNLKLFSLEEVEVRKEK